MSPDTYMLHVIAKAFVGLGTFALTLTCCSAWATETPGIRELTHSQLPQHQQVQLAKPHAHTCRRLLQGLSKACVQAQHVLPHAYFDLQHVVSRCQTASACLLCIWCRQFEEPCVVAVHSDKLELEQLHCQP